MQDTILTLAVTTQREHKIRIDGVHGEDAQERFRDAVEGARDIDEVIINLEGEGAYTVEYDAVGRLLDAETECLSFSVAEKTSNP